ncbi:uncharacterized protein AMSG_00926 [Thecamonas trahens ATCC 50062]|uniref:C2 domain-containing protein n=1 Tax=Thecamonas trahens ATCC 50062 TaxID=461836 RepID=A0A0L0DL48_THETB|nr:hypothetical protein AMSG_00926 [Thecamonas trahens ATCC 50062]KNC52098.1 hypothetical protein AMSG_00926 [Thecamonas trahens ATCC 50062]|eukprot:XP_013762103.1 hypothetical protein AMSG_00926 [Thecamonas trahens ATCC 50062]
MLRHPRQLKSLRKAVSESQLRTLVVTRSASPVDAAGDGGGSGGNGAGGRSRGRSSSGGADDGLGGLGGESMCLGSASRLGEVANGTIVVQLLCGTALAPKDKTGTSDPFVGVWCVPAGAWPPGTAPSSRSADAAALDAAAYGKPVYTDVAWRNLNPTWRQARFELPLVDASDVLVFRVFDKDRIGRSDFMGEAMLPVAAALRHAKPRHAVLALAQRGFASEAVSGHIELVFAAIPPGRDTRRITLDTLLAARQMDVDEVVLPREFEAEPRFEVSDAGEKPGQLLHVLENPHELMRWVTGAVRATPARTPDVFVYSSATEGVLAVAVVAEALPLFGHVYWVAVFSKTQISRHTFEDESPEVLPFDAVLGAVRPELAAIAPYFARVPPSAAAGLSTLQTLEASDAAAKRVKIGVLIAREGQTLENEMYANCDATAAEREFLELLGTRVRLKGFDGYAAQLDTTNDGSGTHSYYRAGFAGYDIMFHVSTELQYDATDAQHIQRKRFIGNDIVVIVFVDGSTPFHVDRMTSQYTNVVLVVHHDVACNGYRLTVVRKKGVQPFVPLLATSQVYAKTEDFATLLLTKAINGETATFVSTEFAIRAARTRANYLDSMLDALRADHDAGPLVERMLAHKLPRLTRSGQSTHALSVVKPGDVACSMLGALAAAELPNRIVEAHPLLTEFPFFVRCLSSVVGRRGERVKRVLFASAKGLFVNVLGTRSVTKVLDLVFIEQILVSEEADLLVVRTGGRRAAVLAFPLVDLLAGLQSSTMYVPVQSPTLVRLGEVDGVVMVFVAARTRKQGNAISIFAREPESGEIFRLETLHVDGVVTALMPTRSGVLVGLSARPLSKPGGEGCDAEASASDDVATFSFWSWELAQREFVPKTLLQRDGEQAVAAFSGLPEGRALLAFSSHALFVSATGVVDTNSTLKFGSAPLHLAYDKEMEVIVAYHATYVAVYAAASGAIVDMHPLRTLGRFGCSGPLLLSPTMSELGTPGVAELVIRGSDAPALAVKAEPASPTLRLSDLAAPIGLDELVSSAVGIEQGASRASLLRGSIGSSLNATFVNHDHLVVQRSSPVLRAVPLEMALDDAADEDDELVDGDSYSGGDVADISSPVGSMVGGGSGISGVPSLHAMAVSYLPRVATPVVVKDKHEGLHAIQRDLASVQRRLLALIQNAPPSPPVCGVTAVLGSVYTGLGQGVFQGEAMTLVTAGMDVWMLHAGTTGSVAFMKATPSASAPADFELEHLAAIQGASGSPTPAGVGMDCAVGASGNYSTLSSGDDCSWFRVVLSADECAARGEALTLRFNKPTASAPSPSPGAACSLALGDTFVGTAFGEAVTLVLGPGGATTLNGSTNGLYLMHTSFSSDVSTMTVRDVAAPTPGSSFATCNYTDSGSYDVTWSSDCSTITLRDVSADSCPRVLLLDALELKRYDPTPAVTKPAPRHVKTLGFNSTKITRAIIVLASVSGFCLALNVCLASARKRSSPEERSSRPDPLMAAMEENAV